VLISLSDRFSAVDNRRGGERSDWSGSCTSRFPRSATRPAAEI